MTGATEGISAEGLGALVEIMSYLENLPSWKKKAGASFDPLRAQASQETIMKAAVS